MQAFKDSLDKFTSLLHCPLCTQMMSNPYILKECGHSFCRKCILSKHRSKQSKECPKCSQAFLIRDVAKNSMLYTIIQCTRKIQDNLQRDPPTANKDNVHDSEAQREKDQEQMANKKKTPVSAMRRLELHSTIQQSTPTTPTRRPAPSFDSEEGGNGGGEDDDKTPRFGSSNAKGKHPATLTRQNGKEPSSKKSKATPLKEAQEKTRGPTKQQPASITRGKRKPAAGAPRSKATTAVTKYTLCTSSLSPINQETIEQSHKHLSSTSTLSSTYTSKTTHLICNQGPFSPRTIKYMRALLDGKFVVGFEWILASISARQFVDEAPFLIKGDLAMGVESGAPERCLGDHPCHRRIFQACKFKLEVPSGGNGARLKADLAKLIVAGGGLVVGRGGAGRRSGEDDRKLVRVYDPSSLTKACVDKDCMSVPYTKIFDCISSLTLLFPTN